MIPTREILLAQCAAGVEQAQAAGAREAEVVVDATEQLTAGGQSNDLHQIEKVAETRYGVRVLLDGGRVGFATTNRADRLAQAAADAVAVARVAPPDPLAMLPQPQPIPDAPDVLGEDLLAQTPAALASALVDLMDAVRAQDRRVSIDKASLEVETFGRAIVSSLGVSAAWRCATTSAMVFGMAVDGDDVGSFSYDMAAATSQDGLAAQLPDMVARFVRNCTGALAAQPGESFRGPVVLTEEVVLRLLVGPLLSALSASQVRQKSSALAGRLGERIGHERLTLTELGAGLPALPLAPFDREGMPRAPRPLVSAGVLQSYLWSSYEAKAAGRTGEFGHAQGSASAPPVVGAAAVALATGSTPPEALVQADGPLLIATRFSGNPDPISGDFSGVVKGGFLVRGGERRPVREVTIAGNLLECLHNISAISTEARRPYSTFLIPALRIEDISVTAG